MTRKKRFLYILLLVLLGTNSQAQHSYFSPIQFNVKISSAQKSDGGLKVHAQLGTPQKVSVHQAGLEADTYQERQRFTLMITVSNDGADDIMISDWAFRAICPQNSMGLEWQENSSVPLVTPYVPNDAYVVLKPGEKKTFQSAMTDFYWCLPKDEKSLLQLPEYMMAVITCARMEKTNPSNPAAQNPATSSNPDAFEPSFEEMIQAVKAAYAKGNETEADALKKEVLEIGGHVYPDRIAEIRAMLEHKPVTKKPVTAQTKSDNIPPKATPNQSAYSNWLYINSDKAVQERFSLAYEEGDFGYFNVQIRLNRESDVFCRDARCQGYLVAFGYPDAQGRNNIYKHFRIYNSYTGIYEFAEPIAVRLRFPDGSKRMLQPEGFFYTTPDNSQPMPAENLLYSCVDEIISGLPRNRCSGRGNWRDIYKDSEALILK